MEGQANLIETLIKKATDYGQVSFELAKLRVLDKTSEVVSSFLYHAIFLIIILLFGFFLSLGLAIWIGQILGEIYFGFLAVAGFYGIAAILVYFFMRKWIKMTVGNSFIKQVLN